MNEVIGFIWITKVSDTNRLIIEVEAYMGQRVGIKLYGRTILKKRSGTKKKKKKKNRI